MEKDCTKCGVSKPLEMFGKHKNGLYGRNSECKECQAKRDKKSKSKRKKDIQEYNKKWKTENREYVLEYAKQYSKEKYTNDPLYRLKSNIRCSINVRLKNHLKTKKGSTLDYLGCDWKTFISHIESQWDGKMNWNNYGRGKYWEIDHIIPISKGGLFHYTNCQPMCITENRQKYNKL